MSNAPASSPIAPDERSLLLFATAALRDLSCGFPHDEIAAPAPSGVGLGELLRCLVTHLRGRGVDDASGWDCAATDGIAVTAMSVPEDLRACLVELKVRGLDLATCAEVFSCDAAAH